MSIVTGDNVFTSLQIYVKMVTNNLSVVKILKGVFSQLDSQTVGISNLLLSTGGNT